MKVFIATPTYDRAPDIDYQRSVLDTFILLTAMGVQALRAFEVGDCYVHKARNSLFTQFLETDCTDFVFLDQDVGFEAAKLIMLLSMPHDFLCGIYPAKTDKELFPVCFEQDAMGNFVKDEYGCLSLELAPTGFWRLRRNVIERLAAASGTYQHRDTKHVNVFKTPITGGTFLGEDTHVCRMWRSMGEQIWCYPDIDFTHVGKKAWTGNLATSLRREADAKAEYQSWLPSAEVIQITEAA